MRIHPLIQFAPVALALSLGACGDREDASSRAAADSAADAATAGPTSAASAPSRVASADGFSTPESVLYDADQDVFFVSNINGSPLQKDGNGFISRMRTDGTVDSLKFTAGGVGGVTLHAPKGMALIGDTIWVSDIDALRGFNRRTGAPVASIEFGRRAKFLNDVAVGPDNALYITDTGVEAGENGEMAHSGPDRIFRVDAGRKITIAAEGDVLSSPNGITWDKANNRFIVVPFGGTSLMEWKPEGKPTPIGSGPGMQDGVEILADGRALISSWVDSSLFALANGQTTKVITGVNSPADIGLDTQRNRVAIPLFMENRVELWQLPAAR